MQQVSQVADYYFKLKIDIKMHANHTCTYFCAVLILYYLMDLYGFQIQTNAILNLMTWHSR